MCHFVPVHICVRAESPWKHRCKYGSSLGQAGDHCADAATLAAVTFRHGRRRLKVRQTDHMTTFPLAPLKKLATNRTSCWKMIFWVQDTIVWPYADGATMSDHLTTQSPWVVAHITKIISTVWIEVYLVAWSFTNYRPPYPSPNLVLTWAVCFTWLYMFLRVFWLLFTPWLSSLVKKRICSSLHKYRKVKNVLRPT